MGDPLSEFRVWEGQQLGDEFDKPPGFDGTATHPKNVLHYAGGDVMSTARTSPEGDVHPGVWLRMIVRAIGSKQYRVIEGFIETDIAVELGTALTAAAQRAPLDVAAAQRKEHGPS